MIDLLFAFLADFFSGSTRGAFLSPKKSTPRKNSCHPLVILSFAPRDNSACRAPRPWRTSCAAAVRRRPPGTGPPYPLPAPRWQTRPVPADHPAHRRHGYNRWKRPERAQPHIQKRLQNADRQLHHRVDQPEGQAVQAVAKQRAMTMEWLPSPTAKSSPFPLACSFSKAARISP